MSERGSGWVWAEHRFTVPVWDDAARDRAVAFWGDHGVAFDEISPRVLRGRRGDWRGDLAPVAVDRQEAELTVTVSSQNEVLCVLDVRVLRPGLSEWSKAWLDLEMGLFESSILRRPAQQGRWNEFLIRHFGAMGVWLLARRLFDRDARGVGTRTELMSSDAPAGTGTELEADADRDPNAAA